MRMNPNTPREVATLLAALRFWQAKGMPKLATEMPFPMGDIATADGEFEPLSADEIDALCERINVP